jgi:hypothetical protein
VLRAVCLVCAAYTASVLDNAFGRMGYEERELAFQRADEVLAEFACWPFGSAGEAVGFGGGGSSANTPGRRKQSGGTRIATGSSGDGSRESILGLLPKKTLPVSPAASAGVEGEDSEDVASGKPTLENVSKLSKISANLLELLRLKISGHLLPPLENLGKFSKLARISTPWSVNTSSHFLHFWTLRTTIRKRRNKSLTLLQSCKVLQGSCILTTSTYNHNVVQKGQSVTMIHELESVKGIRKGFKVQDDMRYIP